MKIAVISDIHSNIFALEAVINDIKKQGVDLIVNLGDILYGPIAPKATFDLLMTHDIVTIRGNQDRQIYEAQKAEIDANPTLSFILEDLGDEPLTWMRNLPASLHLSDNVFLCHGTPTNDLIYLLENVSSGKAALREDSEITELLGGESSKLVLCGHTHTPRTVQLKTGQLIVNPGSVGLPAYADEEPIVHVMETFSPLASYAIIENVNNHWQTNHLKVPYDYLSAAKKAKEKGRMDWYHALKTGRAT